MVFLEGCAGRMARPGAPILAEGKKELDRLGIGNLMFVPELRKAYEY